VSTLAKLPVGSKGLVASIAGDDDVSIRLMEMGIIPGTEILVVGLAPLGDPIEIELRNYRLSLRHAEAARIVIESSSLAPK
jgi:ferrous iron transport protein A